jgi:uncharacterized protein YjiS (DUF1127 family)
LGAHEESRIIASFPADSEFPQDWRLPVFDQGELTMNAVLVDTRHAIMSAPRLGSLLATWATRTRSRRHLAALDDRMLADVGLTRNSVIAEVRKPFWVA